MQLLKTTATCFILVLLTLASPALAEDSEAKTEYDMTGTWKVLLSNSLSRKQVTFVLEQADGRPRGVVNSKELEEAQKLDGRLEEDNTFFLWGKFFDRVGNSTEYEFKGTIEGEPGKEKIKGRCDYFGKSYDFVGVRARKKKKR